jgi:hypothetical protein
MNKKKKKGVGWARFSSLGGGGWKADAETKIKVEVVFSFSSFELVEKNI